MESDAFRQSIAPTYAYNERNDGLMTFSNVPSLALLGFV